MALIHPPKTDLTEPSMDNDPEAWIDWFDGKLSVQPTTAIKYENLHKSPTYGHIQTPTKRPINAPKRVRMPRPQLSLLED